MIPIYIETRDLEVILRTTDFEKVVLLLRPLITRTLQKRSQLRPLQNTLYFIDLVTPLSERKLQLTEERPTLGKLNRKARTKPLYRLPLLTFSADQPVDPNSLHSLPLHA